MRGHELSPAATLPRLADEVASPGTSLMYSRAGLNAPHHLSRLLGGRATRVPDRTGTQGHQRTTTVTVTPP
jgi:hypothetical protein